jgi:lysophospholipase L1-like esterase
MRRTSLLSVLAVLGCHNVAPVSAVPAGDPRIAYIGRFDKLARDRVRFAWSGSRIELSFAGHALRMRMTDVPLEDEVRETDWFEVRVDGGGPHVLHAREGEQVYELASELAPGVHHASIVKRTEPEVGTAILHGFELDPNQGLAPHAQRTRRHIELVGDSITAGYGNLGGSPNCHWSAQREDIEQTYGAFAARELNASYTAIAWSGKGVLRNFRDEDRETIPFLYERVIPTDAASPRAAATPAADVVVVNLGTNDFFPGVPEHERFVASYSELVTRLRARYPKALLVLVIGPMLADDFPQPNSRTLAREWITSVRDTRHALGDSAVETLELWFDPAEGLGCDFHPNVKTHARLGRELAKLIRERLSW